MARKAREILKSRGYSDEELNSVALLTDARFCKAIEDEDTERERLAGLNTKYEEDLRGTAKWYQETAVPTINKLTQDAIEAKAVAASERAKVQALQDLGLFKVAEQQGGQGNQSGQGGGNGQNGQGNTGGNGGQGNGGRGNNDQGNRALELDDRYVSRDVFTATADQFGDALATLHDIGEDHRELFGKRLNAKELRTDYKKAVSEHRFSGDITAFWEQKYNVGAKRTENVQKAQQDHDEKIRKEERIKVTSEFANPMTRTPTMSRNPFVAKQVTNGSTDGKQPWEKGPTVEQRRGERVVKFANKIIEKGA